MSESPRYREIRVRIPEDSPILRWIALPPERRGEVYVALIAECERWSRRGAESHITEDGGPEAVAAIKESIATALTAIGALRALSKAQATQSDDLDGSGL